MVVAIWHESVNYHGDEPYWRVTLRCAESQVWQWKHPNEEDAVRMVDELAAQVNGSYASGELDTRPHARACGIRRHPHGSACSADCPTCGGADYR
jgi:hypothetical protein